jgi:hypothetical protein
MDFDGCPMPLNLSATSVLAQVSVLFSRGELAKRIGDFCLNVKAQSTLEPAIIVLYYSGHGLITSLGDHMMMSVDWDSSWLAADDSAAEGAGYSVEQAMRYIMAASPGCHLVTLLDTFAQHTSKDVGRFNLENKLKPAVTSGAVVVGYACKLSPVPEGSRNSVYTSYLLQVSHVLKPCRNKASNCDKGLHAFLAAS